MSLILFRRLYDISRPTGELIERKVFGEGSRKVEKDEYQEMIVECDNLRPLRDLRIAIFGLVYREPEADTTPYARILPRT